MNVDWKILSYFIQWHFSFIGNGRQRDRWNLKKKSHHSAGKWAIDSNGAPFSRFDWLHRYLVRWNQVIRMEIEWWPDKAFGAASSWWNGRNRKRRFSRTKLKNNLSLYNDMMMTMTIKMATVPPTPKSNSAKMATTGSLLLILPLPLIQSSWLRATLTTGEQEGKGEITKKKIPCSPWFHDVRLCWSIQCRQPPLSLCWRFLSNCLINRQPLYSAGLCVTFLQW